MSYNLDQVLNILDDLEDYSYLLSPAELRNIVLARDYIENDEEIPRWLLVKITQTVRKIRNG